MASLKQQVIPPCDSASSLAEYDIPGAAFNPTHLTLDGGLTREEWFGIGGALVKIHESSRWWIGDWLNYGRRTFSAPVAFDLAAQVTSLSQGSLRGCAWIARTFPPQRRVPTLSYCHHMAVASCSPELGDRLLAEANELGYTTRELQLIAARETGKPKPDDRLIPVTARFHENTYIRLRELAQGMHVDLFVRYVVEDWLKANGEENAVPKKLTTAEQRAEREAKGICVMCGTNPIDNERTPTERYPAGRAVKDSRMCQPCRILGQKRYHKRMRRMQ